MPAPAALDALDRTRRRSNHRDFVAGAGGYQLAQPLTGVDRPLRRRVLDEAAEDDVGEAHVGRVWRVDAPHHLLTHERDIVVRYGEAHGVVAGESRLDQNASTL